MDIHVVAAFPEMVSSPIEKSILKRARDKDLVQYHFYDLRDFTRDKHRQIDDYPYGGGPGMVLKPEPIIRCVEAIKAELGDATYRIILPTPQGPTFSQQMAQDFLDVDNLIFICGHYKGIDERVMQYFQPDEISIGNYVLSSGEIAALVIIDSVVRLIPGVLNDFDSAATDTFQGEFVDCPLYTRPVLYQDMSVPDVLISGNHAKIAAWRQEMAQKKTQIKYKAEIKKPDLAASTIQPDSKKKGDS